MEPKTFPRPRRFEAEAIEALEGRRAPSLRQLLELIHEVNPTGRELAEAETARRYRLKARLQSLLVRRFGEELRIVRNPVRPGVVSLDHAHLPGDGCHAVVSELDEDARSWVQLREDLGLVPAPARAPEAQRPAPRARTGERRAAGGGGLLASARLALDSYDFEQARALFEEALEELEGSAQAASPLLELLVDQLAAYPDALAVQERLSAEALRHPEVKLWLALAAAHSEQPVQARRWLEAVDAPRGAEVLALLARQALGRGELDAAAEHLSEARRRGWTHPELVELAGQLAEKVRQAREPREEALRRLWSDGRADEAEREASAMLERWPESGAARRVLSELAAARRAREVEALCARAGEARGADPARAAELLRQALGLDPSRVDLTARLGSAEGAARQQDEERRVAEVRALLSAEPRVGLGAYEKLNEPLRARVRAAPLRPELAWLEEAGQGHGGRAAVEAVLALGLAREALGRGELEPALALLGAHPALRGVPDAREADAQARALDEGRRLLQAREALQQAREAHRAGGLERIPELLPAWCLPVLPAPERLEAQSLLEEAARLRELAREAARVEELAARGELLAARDAAEALARAVPEGERARWTERRDALTAGIRRAFRVHVDVGSPAGAPLDFVDPVPGLVQGAGPHCWLEEDGRTLWLASAHERWLFLREVDVSTGRIRRQARLRTSAPLAPLFLHVEGGVLTVCGGAGEVMELSTEGLEVLRAGPLPLLLEPGEVVNHVLRIPGTRFSWWRLRRGAAAQAVTRVVVVDLERRRVHRTLGAEQPILLPGRPPRLLRFEGRAAVIHSAQGSVEEHVALPDNFLPLSAAPHPSGRGLWLAGTRARGNDAYLQLVEVAEGGATSAPIEWKVPVEVASGTLATVAMDGGLGFASLDGHEGMGWSLVALRQGASGPEELAKPLLRGPAVLARDADGRHAVALLETPRELRVLPLGPVLPDLSQRGRGRFERPRLHTHGDCVATPFIVSNVPDQQHKTAGTLLKLSPRRRAEMLRARMAAGALLQEVLFLLWIMREAGHREEVLELLREVTRRCHPRESASLALVEAQLLTDVGRWEEALQLLSREDVRALDLGELRGHHVAHLRGSALLHLGDEAGALEAWEAGVQMQGSCGLYRCLDLVEPLSDPPPEEWGVETELQQLRSAVRFADSRRSQGDAAGALRAIEHWTVLAAGELQSAARLADLHLSQPAATPEERFRKTVALSSLLDVHGGGAAWELLLGAETWDLERIAGVAQRAAQWLDGPQSG